MLVLLIALITESFSSHEWVGDYIYVCVCVCVCVCVIALFNQISNILNIRK